MTLLNKQGTDEDIERRKRLSALIKAVGGREAASEIADVSGDMLRRYQKDSRIALLPVGKLCTAANMSLDWLFSGEGNQYKESPSSKPDHIKEDSQKYTALADAMTHAPNGYKIPSKITALILELVSDYDVNPKAINRIIEVMADLEKEKSES